MRHSVAESPQHDTVTLSSSLPKLQALVYDILPALEEGAGKRCSECVHYHENNARSLAKSSPRCYGSDICKITNWDLSRSVGVAVLKNPYYLGYALHPVSLGQSRTFSQGVTFETAPTWCSGVWLTMTALSRPLKEDCLAEVSEGANLWYATTEL